MKHSELALKLEIEQFYSEAITEYEIAIKEEEVDVSIYINLAFLYWQSYSQLAWSLNHNIPETIMDFGGERFKDLLTEAIAIFPQNSELYFWEKYFIHRLTYDELNEAEVYKILEQYKDGSDVPYFFLYLFDSVKYKEKRNSLLRECDLLPTAKNLYIKSIIEDRPYEVER